MRLTRTILGLGHEVIVWGPERCRDAVEDFGASFELHEPPMPETRGLGYVAELTATTEALTESLIERLFEADPDLLIHDSQTPWARIAGDYLGLARIVASPMFPIMKPYAKPSHTDHWPLADPEEAQARFSAHWLRIAAKWGVEIESAARLIHSPTETRISFTTEKLVGDYPLGSEWRFVGPLMAPPDTAKRATDRPLVYACFGTAFNGPVDQFEAVVSALAEEPFDVLLSTGGGRVTASDLEPLPSNVTVQEFVDARRVLSSSSVHVTHGGCNSVHESLLFGVPMVGIPQAFDQFELTQRVEALGAGLVSEQTPERIRAAVRSVIASAEMRRRAAELGEHLAGYDGERRVGEVIDRVLAEEGEPVS
jgi:MGT family glycosyltransferase